MAKPSTTPRRERSRERLLPLGVFSLGALASSYAMAQTTAPSATTEPAASPAPAASAAAAPGASTVAPGASTAAPGAPAAASAPSAVGTPPSAPSVTPPAAAPSEDAKSASEATASSEGAAAIAAEETGQREEESEREPAAGTTFGFDAGDSLVLGLSPGAPQITSLPGGITPAFGEASTSDQVWRFDFHGLVFLPLRIGIGERERPLVGQKVTTLHGPPRTPGNDYEGYEYTGVQPDPWVQLNFSYGNKDVTATVIVAARTVNSGDSYFNPPDHVGINDAFLTYRYPVGKHAAFSLNMGAYAHNYGNMGEYDLGKYGTPLIARVGGSGFTARGDFELGDTVLLTEVGFFGQLNKAPVGIEPAGWNGFADPNVGSSFAVHGHAVGYFDKTVAVGGHAIHAFVQDDRATPLPQNTDGSIDVLGLDLRLMLREFGHLYLGYAHTSADQARAVSGIVRVLNAPGGPGLMKHYFGPDSNNGTGTLDTIGGQYDLSLGHHLRMKENTVGAGPDLVLSPFAVLTMVGSADGTRGDDEQPLYDGITKLKYGLELTHGWFSWLAGSLRYDRVLPNLDDSDQTFAALSPRLIFSSDWGSQDQVVLQYTKWFSGSQSAVTSGYPPEKDPTIVPDGHSLMLSASMWW